VRLVANGSDPLPIDEKHIEDLKLLLAAKSFPTPYPFLKAGQRVRIRGGCLDGVEGILLSRNSGSSLVVSIEAIQRSLAIRLEGYTVEPV
jgi:transcription antitermination factor NusG